MSKRVLLASALLASLVAAPAFAADTGADAPAKDPVIAKVNGKSIHLSDADSQIQMMGIDPSKMPMQMVYPRLLQQMIDIELLSQKGYAEKIQDNPELKKRFKEVEDQFVAEAYVHKAVKPRITEAMVKDAYDKDIAANFKPTDEVRASHILIKVAPDAKPDDVSKAEDKAKDLIKQIKGGADFGKLAEQNSDDPGSAKKGGDLDYFAHDTMVKPFADAAFGMKVGEVSDKPVRTDFGWHIIKVVDKRKSSPPPLAEVRAKIENQIGQKMTADLIKELEAKAKIEKFNPDGTPLKASADAPAAAPDATAKP